MTVDLNRLILGKSYNSTKVFRTAQHVVQAILLGFVVPALILLLIWDLTDNPNPVPGVVVIAGLVMLFVPEYETPYFWLAWAIGGLLCAVAAIAVGSFVKDQPSR